MKPEYREFYEFNLDAYVKIKADFRCERCGRRSEKAFWFAKNYPYVEVRGAGLGLCVHHHDGNPENNRLVNLTCLCRNCHLFQENLNRRFPQVTLLRWVHEGKIE